MDKQEAEIPVQTRESDGHPLVQFVEHQTRAAQEVGRAAISLIPTGLRKHGWNALEESAKGFGVILNAVADGVGDITKAAKDEFVPKDEEDNKE